MVCTNEDDAAGNMDEIKSSNSFLEHLIKNMRVLSRGCWSQISRGEPTLKNKRAQQDNRFLKGRQIDCMICDYFKISGTSEAPFDYNDLMRVQLKSDNMRGFDTKCDEVLLSMTEVPDEDLFEKIVKLLMPRTCRIRRTRQLFSIWKKWLALQSSRIYGTTVQCPQQRQVSSRNSSLEKIQAKTVFARRFVQLQARFKQKERERNVSRSTSHETRRHSKRSWKGEYQKDPQRYQSVKKVKNFGMLPFSEKSNAKRIPHVVIGTHTTADENAESVCMKHTSKSGDDKTGNAGCLKMKVAEELRCVLKYG